MIYELVAPSGMPPIPDVFAWIPSRTLGAVVWVSCALAALAYGLSRRLPSRTALSGIPIPMLFAGTIFAGLFAATYNLVDEVTINLEHAYNLFHYGRFSMSPERWTEGTVEAVYYLLHAPFSWSQHSVIVANYAISLLVGLLHLPLVAYALGPEEDVRKRTLQLGAFALSLPLATAFSSGFGNGLVSLVFLGAIASAVNGRDRRSLVLSGILPLLRPDALLLSVANGAVVMITRWRSGDRVIPVRDLLLFLLPLASSVSYFGAYRLVYGDWIPTPMVFKRVGFANLAITQVDWVMKDLAAFVSSGVPAFVIVALILVAVSVRWPAREGEAVVDRSAVTLALYALATLPLVVLFFTARRTLGDFTYQAYARYWITADVAMLLFVLAVVSRVDERMVRTGNEEPGLGSRRRFVLGGWFCLSMMASVPVLVSVSTPNRIERSVFAGALAERYLPANLILSTTELNMFGLMIERPIVDLWGYTTPGIAHSDTCNGDRIRTNEEFFLRTMPDVYWPYHFSGDRADVTMPMWSYTTVEESLNAFHHTNKKGHLLGDMARVLTEYDIVLIISPTAQLMYLVREPVSAELVAHLQGEGFHLSRSRAIDRDRFMRAYDAQVRLTYACP